MQRQMRLNAFLMHSGHHVAAWRHQDVPATSALDFDQYRYLARVAEQGRFDALFFADHLGLNAGGSGENIAVQHRTARANLLEPVSLLSALAVVTEHIGLIATLSTSYNEPFNVARRFATLDHLSKGRAGWNVVTSATNTEALNFGLLHQREHGSRYERASEFVDVVTSLWDSWEEDAVIADKATARYFDPDKIHAIDHEREYYQVKGPLNVARSPQGRPIIVQAGSSDAGQELAARTADVVFTAQQTVDGARSFYRSLKSRVAKYGRSPDDLKILPGLFVLVGETESEAKDKFDHLQSLLPTEVGIGLLSAQLGNIDLSAYPVDGPLPSDLEEPEGPKGRFQMLTGLARKEGLTIRQLYERVAPARGHLSIYGTASQVVDQMECWIEQDAADGFNVMGPTLPGGLEDFVRLAIPELQRRNLFRREYEGSTLRDRLALPYPRNKFSAARAARHD